MANFKFGMKSMTELETAHEAWQEILNCVIEHYNFSVLEAHRTRDEQNKDFESGASKVQWPNGKHNTWPSLAVDIAPYPLPASWGDLNWKDNKSIIASWKERLKFYELAAIVKFVAANLGHTVRWGGDWDGDGDYNDQTFDDLVHFELVGEQYERTVKIP